MWPTLTLCILMDVSIHIDAMSMGIAHFAFRGHRQNFLNYGVF